MRKEFIRKRAVVAVLSCLLSTGLVQSFYATPANAATKSADKKVEAASLKQEFAYQNSVLQNTPNGILEGFEKEGALHWFGVPYAKTPVGPLRWKAPQKVEKWEGIRQAKESMIGSQKGGLQAAKDKAGNGTVVMKKSLLGSEAGAVTLDITRPATKETNLPVMFYIHGGNNQTGKSAALPASRLAKEINSVIVSINHRMGLLGFNALPALRHGTVEENSGNYGFLDQAAALDWVKENIRSFGGNPDNITVSGSSAGGRDVMAMLISPTFKGKFQKALSFSGGMTTADPEASARVAARHLAPLAVEQKVQPDVKTAENWLLTDSDDVRKFLYGLSDLELANAFGGAEIRMSAFPHLFSDGTVIPKEGFDTKVYNDVPVLMVNGDREFSTFCKRGAPFNKLKAAELMKDENLLPQYKFAEKYGSQMYSYFNGEESATRMLPVYKSPIYTLLIQWGDNPQIAGEEYSTIYGAYHCMSTPLMTHIMASASTGYPALFTSKSFDNMSALLNGYYKNFLWTGDPNGKDINGKGLPKWKAWTKLDGTTQMVVDANDSKAWGKMSKEHTSYAKIIADIEKDTSIPQDQKDKMIQTVLNGRWFSSALDKHFNNKDLWK